MYIRPLQCRLCICIIFYLALIVCAVYPAVSKLCLVVFHAAAAPGSPAVSAPGPGPTHDPPAAGPEPAISPRCHHLLRPLLPLLPAGLPSPAGQRGESVTWWSRQPPRWGRRQVWLDGVPIQLCFYLETWPLAYSLSPGLPLSDLMELKWAPIPAPPRQLQTLTTFHIVPAYLKLTMPSFLLGGFCQLPLKSPHTRLDLISSF